MGGRNRGRETSMCERNIDWLPFPCPHQGTWPATQACALTGNQTSGFLVRRPVLNLLSHTHQGHFFPSKTPSLFGFWVATILRFPSCLTGPPPFRLLARSFVRAKLHIYKHRYAPTQSSSPSIYYHAPDDLI